MRPSLIIGNWKMHGSLDSVRQLLTAILAHSESMASSTRIGVCPSFVHLPLARELLSGSSVSLGAQNAHAEEQGAYTGEVAAGMLAEMGLDYVLVGHSERRQLFTESDADVAAKFLAVQKHGMQPVLCLGETLAEREKGITSEVVLGQLNAIIEAAGIEAFARAVIAYEPVWAIGTGKTASPEQAQEVHAAIRQRLAEKDAEIAANTLLLYGGSVKSGNAVELFSQADIDGGLVGGASLAADEFIAICKSAD